jgi:CxxH/CxxC protein (TIGR04129 family)
MKRGGQVFVVCAEHVEMALEDFVNEYEQSPDIYVLAETSFTAWEAPAHCEYCERPPKYLIV